MLVCVRRPEDSEDKTFGEENTVTFFYWPVGGDSPAQSLIKLLTKVIKIIPIYEVTLLVHPVVQIYVILAQTALQSASIDGGEKKCLTKTKTQLFRATS